MIKQQETYHQTTGNRSSDNRKQIIKQQETGAHKDRKQGHTNTGNRGSQIQETGAYVNRELTDATGYRLKTGQETIRK